MEHKAIRWVLPATGVLLLAVLVWLLVPMLRGAQTRLPDRKVALTFYQQREEAMDGFAEVIALFSEEYPHIEVQQQNVPSALEMLIARMQQRDVPDLFTHWPTQTSFASAVADNLVMDISALDIASAVDGSTLALCRQEDGGAYALPLNRNLMEVYYNAELFEQHGLTPPQTMEELFALCEAFQEKGVLPFLFYMRDNRMAHVAQAVFAVVLEDYLDVMERMGSGTLTDAALEQVRLAAATLKRLYDYSQPEQNPAYTYYQACERFAAGESAMFLCGSYALNSILEFPQVYRMSVFPLPGYDAARRVLLSGIDTAVCIAKDTPYPAEALLFLEFLMRPEVASRYAQHDLAPSCMLDVVQENEMTQAMRGHVETYDNVEWLKSRFSFESVTSFEDAVKTFLLSGDEETFLADIRAAFVPAR